MCLSAGLLCEGRRQRRPRRASTGAMAAHLPPQLTSLPTASMPTRVGCEEGRRERNGLSLARRLVPLALPPGGGGNNDGSSGRGDAAAIGDHQRFPYNWRAPMGQESADFWRRMGQIERPRLLMPPHRDSPAPSTSLSQLLGWSQPHIPPAKLPAVHVSRLSCASLQRARCAGGQAPATSYCGGCSAGACRGAEAPRVGPAESAAIFPPHPFRRTTFLRLLQVHALLEHCLVRGMTRAEATAALSASGVKAQFSTLGGSRPPPPLPAVSSSLPFFGVSLCTHALPLPTSLPLLARCCSICVSQCGIGWRRRTPRSLRPTIASSLPR